MARVALSRIYFAVFHAARALLAAEGFEPKSHAGVQHLFGSEIVRSGRFSTSDARLLVRLQKFREQADYATAFVVDPDGAREDLDAARRFLEKARRELAGSSRAG